MDKFLPARAMLELEMAWVRRASWQHLQLDSLLVCNLEASAAGRPFCNFWKALAPLSVSATAAPTGFSAFE